MQSQGDFVCVRVDRYKKSNLVKVDDKDEIRYSGQYYNFEFFRIREKEIPVDSIEIKGFFFLIISCKFFFLLLLSVFL